MCSMHTFVLAQEPLHAVVVMLVRHMHETPVLFDADKQRQVSLMPIKSCRALMHLLSLAVPMQDQGRTYNMTSACAVSTGMPHTGFQNLYNSYMSESCTCFEHRQQNLVAWALSRQNLLGTSQKTSDSYVETLSNSKLITLL